MGAASTDPVAHFFAVANAKLDAIYKEGVVIFKEVEDEAVLILGIAKQDLPVLLDVVNGLATLTAVFVPGAAIIPFIADVASIVSKVDKYVVTADGILADPSTAVTVANMATAAQKATEATAQVVAAYPTVHPAVAAAHVALATAKAATQPK